MASQKFTDVVVWQKAHRFTLSVYRFTESLPKHEFYSLGDQMRRAAVSIPANFVEGFKKRGRADEPRFYNIAQGSLEESRYFLILCHDLGYGDTTQLSSDLEEVSRLLEAYCDATERLAPKTC
ncbi:MAG: four helix bundle protein [Gemmataceae bacterium]